MKPFSPATNPITHPASTTAVVIGGGQAGLAMSRNLTERSIDHVVLERGEVGNSWRTERWDSLRLLTPNWMTRLPGFAYNGDDPDGYMTAAETASFLDHYRRIIDAPIVEGVTVTAVKPLDCNGTGDGPERYDVITAAGTWRCRSVIVATGACSTPRVPMLADNLPAGVQQLAPIHYRNPDQIDPGRVLVVGPSASGAQIADELARAGRDVTLAVGHHVRLPRAYRGMNIHWWMDTLGLLDEGYDQVDDIARARRVPSLQLVGSPEQRDLDLNTLAGNGVQLAGRLAGITDSHVQFSGSLANAITSADLKMGRLLDQIDEFVEGKGLTSEVEAANRPDPIVIPESPLMSPVGEFGTVIWATGFRPNYPWLPEAVLDAKGAVVHDGGVMNLPGMYILGLPFLRRRKSSFLDGVGPDSADLADHLAGHLAGRRIPVGI